MLQNIVSERKVVGIACGSCIKKPIVYAQSKIAVPPFNIYNRRGLGLRDRDIPSAERISELCVVTQELYRVVTVGSATNVPCFDSYSFSFVGIKKAGSFKKSNARVDSKVECFFYSQLVQVLFQKLGSVISIGYLKDLL